MERRCVVNPKLPNAANGADCVPPNSCSSVKPVRTRRAQHDVLRSCCWLFEGAQMEQASANPRFDVCLSKHGKREALSTFTC